MKLLVCGGRDYWDWPTVQRVLDAVHAKRPVTLVITGHAPGADALAETWASVRGVACTGERYKVTSTEWKRFGPAAGPMRNQRMLDEQQPDGVVAFPGGKGTRNMVGLARAAGVTVYDPLRAWPS